MLGNSLVPDRICDKCWTLDRQWSLHERETPEKAAALSDLSQSCLEESTSGTKMGVSISMENSSMDGGNLMMQSTAASANQISTTRSYDPTPVSEEAAMLKAKSIRIRNKAPTPINCSAYRGDDSLCIFSYSSCQVQPGIEVVLQASPCKEGSIQLYVGDDDGGSYHQCKIGLTYIWGGHGELDEIAPGEFKESKEEEYPPPPRSLFFFISLSPRLLLALVLTL